MDDTPKSPASARAARRRYLTILFSDLSDSTALAGSIEPEHYLEVLDHLQKCAYGIVPKHGGTVIDFRGDGFLAMFGYPEASELDGRNATEAALELHEAISHGSARIVRRPPPLSLHSGIHSGLVLLIEGEPAPGRFSLIGEAPNIAARLSDAAGRNEILVSATTLGTERHFFETKERGALSLDGKSEPVSTYQVLARAAVATRFEARTQRGLTPFVGRTHLLDRLERRLQAAIAGEMQTVSIVAPPGLGKTRLAEEFLRRAPPSDCEIHRGYCESHQTAEPLQPFLQILRAICSLDDGSAVPSRSTVPTMHTDVSEFRSELVRALHATGITGQSGKGRRIANDDATTAICALIEAVARRTPVILFLDDWQWADEASRRVVAALREHSAQRLLVLISSRGTHPGESFGHGGDVIELTPLDEADATETIRALRPDADPFVVRQIQELSGGNPLFIEELCHSAARERGRDAPVRPEESPAWLSTLIESRVSRLPPDEGELIRAAAIIGNVVPVWLLQLITGRGEHDAEVRALAAKDLLYPTERPGVLRFKHGITRDVVYNAIGLAEREQTHFRVAQLIDEKSAPSGKDELLETLAYHYQAGAEPAMAAHYAELAGHKAMAAPALDRARTQYAAALAALDLLPRTDDQYRRWMSIAQRFGLACVYDPTRDQLQVFRRAVELASARKDNVALARAEYWLGYITYALGEVKTAILQCERARRVCAHTVENACDEALVGELEPLAVQVLATLGQAHSAACEHELAVAELDEVIAARRRHKGGGRLAAGSAYTLACKGASLGDQGRFSEAQDCFGEALEAVTGGDHAVKGSVLNWQGGVYLWQGRWSDALAVGLEAGAIAERIESLYVLGMARAITAYARWMLDRDPQAIEALVRATSWLEARDKRLFISVPYGWLASALVETDRVDEARGYAARALQRARERDRFGAAMAYRAVARMPLLRREHDYYLTRAMDAAVSRRSQHEIAVTLLDRAELEQKRGRRIEAAALLARARSAFEAMDMTWHAAKAQQLLLSAV